MSTATELLRRALKFLDYRRIGSDTLEKDIKTFLAAETEKEPLIWLDGSPPKPYGNEWFIAETTYGDRVVLKALPDEYSYDYKTADETYIKADKIRRWMQFPDSGYCLPRPEPEAEPVFIRPDHLALARKSPFLCRVEPKQRDDFVPLYTRPEPARKPMTHEEIIQGVTVDTSDDFHAGYWAGIRFAEKHHFGIGVNPSDPDSIDLQSRCRGDKL